MKIGSSDSKFWAVLYHLTRNEPVYTQLYSRYMNFTRLFPRFRTYKTGCPAFLRVTALRKADVLEVTEFKSQHNHPAATAVGKEFCCCRQKSHENPHTHFNEQL